jgi:hypothetical protein
MKIKIKNIGKKHFAFYLTLLLVGMLFNIPSASAAYPSGLPAPCSPGICYIDPASVGGDGTTTATTGPHAAFKNIWWSANYYTFAPGDQILLKRGAVFKNDRIGFMSSGTKGNPITYGAYGDGPAPKLDGSVIVSGLSSATASGNITRANMKISGATSGVTPSFVDFGGTGGIDLATYAGALLDITDSSGRHLKGYIKAAGTGETFSTTGGALNDGNFVTNGTFDADTDWTEHPTGKIAGGVLNLDANTSCEQTLTGYPQTVGNLVKVTGDVSKTGGGNLENTASGYLQTIFSENQTYASASGPFVFYGTSENTNQGMSLYSGAAGLTGTVDNVALHTVLTPSSTGVTITNTAKGTVNNWVSQDAGFNFNDPAGYTFLLLPNVYKATTTSQATFGVWFDDVFGNMKTSFDLTAQYDWHWENGVLYVYASADPATLYTHPGIEKQTSEVNITIGANYITVKDLEMEKAIVGIFASNTTGVTLDSNKISEVGDGIVNNGTLGNSEFVINNNDISQVHTFYNNNTGAVSADGGGIALSAGDTPNAVITNNRLSDIDAYGIATVMDNVTGGIISGNTVSYTCQNAKEGDSGALGTNGNNWVIKDNIVNHGCIGVVVGGGTNNTVLRNTVQNCSRAGVWVFHVNITNINIGYNLLVGNKYGVDTYGGEVNVFNNTIIGSEIAGITMYHPPKLTIRNNIIQDTIGLYDIYVTYNAGAITIDHNNYYRANGGNNWYWRGVAKNFTDWKIATGSTGELNMDSLFFSPTNYQLFPNSPLINAGVDVGLTTDILGNPIVGRPDIGAYEFQPNVTKAIAAFSFASPAAAGTLDEANHTIKVIVPIGTNLTNLTPTITHTGASIAPASGTPQNFTNPVIYTVTAGDSSTQTYTVTVTFQTAPKKKSLAKRVITTSPKKAGFLTLVTQSGKRFSKNSKVALHFRKLDGSYYPPMLVKTNGDGKFKTTYLIKLGKPKGTYSWYATDLKTGKKSKKSSYVVR